MFSSNGLVAVITLSIASCGTEQTQVQPEPIPDVARWVDPFIGSKGPGNVVPGPCVPHGMVKLSPDT
ncbi:MAG: hypothetical protein GXP54_12505, partial [Deltaproteobacteria bacterium]|nr:hypothetical protein [Deltaproteobacteria bacterium]